MVPYIFILLALLFCPFAHASPPGPTQSKKPPQTPSDAESPAADKTASLFSLDAPYLTGDWLGLRTHLADRGVRVNAYFNQHYQKILQGGTELQGSGRTSGTIDVILDFDLQKLDLLPRSQLFIHVRRQWGAGVNPFTQTLMQINDDADGNRTLHIDQLWVAHRLLDDTLTLRIGFVDYQTIVDRNRFANSEDIQFWNQALDNNALTQFVALAGLGAAAIYHPADAYTLILGVGDGDTVLYKPGFSTTFHDRARLFAYMEHGFRVTLPSVNGPLEGNYRLGLAFNPRPKPVYDESFNTARSRRSHEGDLIFYASFDQTLFRESAGSDQGLGCFLRYAIHRSRFDRVASTWSAGFQYKGPIPHRDDDVLGLAFAALVESGPYRRTVNPDAAAETVYEIYYAYHVGDWLVISPDVQYVTNPGGDGRNSDLLAIGVRTRFAF